MSFRDIESGGVSATWRRLVSLLRRMALSGLLFVMFAGICCGCARDGADNRAEVADDIVVPADEAVSEDGASPDVSAEACTPGETWCVDGMTATCAWDGLDVALAPCPRGRVCEGTGCVPNLPRVVIAVDSPWSVEPGTSPFLPASLVTAALEDACASDAQCCELDGADGALTLSVVAKYWLRRLLRDLDGKAHVVVVAPPTDANPSFDDDLCAPEDIMAQRSSCAGGDTPLLTRPAWDALQAQIYSANAVRLPSGLPVPRAGEPGADALAALLGRITRLDQTARPSMTAWVDGGPGPEMQLAPAGQYPMALLSFLEVASYRDQEVSPCDEGGTCPDARRTCVDGLCVDTAQRCRTHEVIHLGPLSAQSPSWANRVCGGGPGLGTDLDLWALWLRWGAECDKGGGCRDGSSCVDACGYSILPCGQHLVCIPDSLDRAADLTALRRALHEGVPRGYPTTFAEYADGGLLTARTHVMLGGLGVNARLDELHETLIRATVAAKLGDGVAVTPCPDDFRLDEMDPNIILDIDCDFETSYARLIDAIISRAADAVCDTFTHVPRRDGAGVP